MMQRFESSDPQTDPAYESYKQIKQYVGWQPSLLNLDNLLAALLDTFISLGTSSSSSPSGSSSSASSGKLPALFFCTMKALELMGVFAGWDWTYERLIRQIWTVMNRAPPMLFGAILRLMGRLAQQGLVESDSAPSEALYDLRLKFAHILDTSSGAKRCKLSDLRSDVQLGDSLYISSCLVSHEVQVSAAQALLDISDGRRENVEALLVWYRALIGTGGSAQPSLPASLQQSVSIMLGA